MSGAVSRRQFLRGEIRQARPVLRPPWARDSAHFPELCTRCGDCLRACPAGILRAGDGGFPETHFENGECTFCGDCVSACQPGALLRAVAPWRLAPAIDDTCLAQRGIVCQVCADQCDARAIRFPPRLDAVAVPVPDPSACTGCGACVAPCPVRAISLTEVP